MTHAITVFIPVVDRHNLFNCLTSLSQQDQTIHLQIRDKNEQPFCWEDAKIANLVIKHANYNANVGCGNPLKDIQKAIQECKTDFFFYLDVRCIFAYKESLSKMADRILSDKTIGCIYVEDKEIGIVGILARTNVLRKVAGLDTNYSTLCSFPFQELVKKIDGIGYKAVKEENGYVAVDRKNYIVNKQDEKRFQDKSTHPLYGKNILYVDGAMGDHVCARPLVIASEGSYICCKTPSAFNSINTIKGFVDWTHPLFGGEGNGFHMYEFGNHHKVASLKEAFCMMYGRPYREENFNFPVYQQDIDAVKKEIVGDRIVVIAPNAAQIDIGDGQKRPANKDWSEIRWLEVVDFLNKYGFTTVQTGGENDWQLPNVNYRFLNRDIQAVAALISVSEFVMCVDTFVHHLASAIGKKSIVISPSTNQHAHHNGNVYITKEIEKDFEDRRWNIDSQIPERKESMMRISVQEVKETIVYFINEKV